MGRWGSCLPPAEQRFGSVGEAGHQLRCCLQVPVGMLDIRVAQIGRQGDEVTGYCLTARRALLQRPGRHGMSIIPTSE